jgi:hypothetical protein
MHPDSAREVKARLLAALRSRTGVQRAGAPPRRPLWVAVGLAPVGPGRVRVAVRLADAADRAVLPDLGRAAAADVDVRVIGPVRPLPSPADHLRGPVRPLRPGVSVAHPRVSAGTLGGFVRVGGALAMLSNNHVLAASDAASVGDPVLQPGPADGGAHADRVATLATFRRLTAEGPNTVDAAVATLDDGVEADPAALPGGALTGPVTLGPDIDPEEPVEKVGRTTGHTSGRITAVEVDAVAVRYDTPSSAHGILVFDDQVEIEGEDGAFSAGGDSGSVIWRSADRAPLGLLFAGSTTGGRAGGGVTYANPLGTVLDELGAEWVADR